MEYIYGKLNKSITPQYYNGANTDTAITHVDNNTSTIRVDVIKLPNKLIVHQEDQDTIFDGSDSVLIDLTPYLNQSKLDEFKDTLFASANLQDSDLIFYKQNGEELARVPLKLSYIENDGDGNSPFITRQQVEDKNYSTQEQLNGKVDELKNLIGETSSSDREWVTNQDYASKTWVNENAGKIDVITLNGETLPIIDKTVSLIVKLNGENIPLTGKTLDITGVCRLSDIDTIVLKNASLTRENDSYKLNKTYINIKDKKETAGEPDLISLANNKESGLMSSENYNTLSDLVTRVGNLEGKTTRLLYSESTDPTAEQIDAYVKSKGYTTPFSGISVVVDKTYHIWHYYENDNIGWRDDGLDTVNSFTNTTAGIIKGAGTVEGKVYAESDGTGSVYGWDKLKADINTKTEQLQTNVNNIQGSVNDLSSQLNQTNSNVTTLQTDTSNLQTTVSTLNSDVTQVKGNISNLQTSKQDKLTAGNNITIVNNVISSTASAASTTTWRTWSN